MKKLTANVFVKNVNTTMEYYESVLGFERVATVPEEGTFNWGMMKSGEVELMFQTFASLGDEFPRLKNAVPPGPLLLYIDVENLGALRQRVEGKAMILKELHDTFYGTKEFALEDCNGFILVFAQGGK